MVLQSIEQNNNNNNTFCKPVQNIETEMENDLLAKIMHLLPEGYNIPANVSQYELIMATIQYINALQSLTAQYHWTNHILLLTIFSRCTVNCKYILLTTPEIVFILSALTLYLDRQSHEEVWLWEFQIFEEKIFVSAKFYSLSSGFARFMNGNVVKLNFIVSNKTWAMFLSFEDSSNYG